MTSWFWIEVETPEPTGYSVRWAITDCPVYDLERAKGLASEKAKRLGRRTRVTDLMPSADDPLLDVYVTVAQFDRKGLEVEP